MCVSQSDISELEAKLAELRQDKVRLQAAISEEEGKIEAIHHELDSENCSLHEERDSLTTREQHLQAQQVYRVVNVQGSIVY